MPAYLGNINVENFNIGNTAIVGIGGGTFFPTDADAIAFISASAITGSADINAINYLVTSLKAYDLWDDMVAFYPMVGATTSSMKWNLMNPQDTDEALRLEYYGGVSASSKGLVFSGAANTFANTNFYSSTDSAITPAYPPIGANMSHNFSNGIYSQTTGSIVGYAAGIRNTGTISRYFIKTTDNVGISSVGYGNSNMTGQLGGTQTGGGLFATSFTTGSQKYYRNDVELVSQTVTNNFFSTDVYTYVLGANNGNGTPNFPIIANPSQITLSTAFMGSYLNPTKYLQLNDIIQGYNNILGRKLVDSVPTTTTSTTTTTTTSTTSTTTTTTTTTLAPGVVTNFINATGITGSAITAVQDLYDDLVAAGIWNNMIAIYPFVGANANSNRYNLANTGSYTLTFNGGWTHNSNGVTSNGTNAYATMGITPSAVGAWEVDSMLGVYNRTDGAQTGYDIGSYTFGNRQTALITEYTTGNAVMLNGSVEVQTAVGDSRGLILWNQYGVAQNFQGIWKNGTQIATLSGNAVNVSGTPLVLGALNAAGTIGDYAARNYALAIVARGMTGTQISSLNSIVTAFETTLGRQV